MKSFSAVAKEYQSVVSSPPRCHQRKEAGRTRSTNSSKADHWYGSGGRITQHLANIRYPSKDAKAHRGKPLRIPAIYRES
jgi:hypothetical protein